MSANSIFPIYDDSHIPYLGKNLLSQRTANFLYIRSNLLEPVIVTDLQAADAYWSLELTKAKYQQ
jgi:hypothetical protein